MGNGCNNSSLDYFLDIKINNENQGERRRLTSFDYLRKDVSGIITNLTLNDAIIIGSALNISANSISTAVNISGVARNIQKNINSEQSSVINTLQNDAGYQFSMSLTGNKNNVTGPGVNNVGTISLNSPNFMLFLHRYNNSFIWQVNPNNNGALNPRLEIMRLKPSGKLILAQEGIDANGSINATGNIITSQNVTGSSGFFSYLGSLANRITKIFIQDINFDGSISGIGSVNITGDVSASNVNVSGAFYGNGSGLTSIPVGGINNYYKYVESNAESSTSSTTFQQKVRLNLTNIPSGDYLVSWNAQFRGDKKSTTFEIQILEDSSTQIDLAQWVPFANNDGGYPKQSGFVQRTLTAGNHTFDLDYRTTTSGDTAAIKNARVMAWKVS